MASKIVDGGLWIQGDSVTYSRPHSKLETSGDLAGQLEYQGYLQYANFYSI